MRNIQARYWYWRIRRSVRRGAFDWDVLDPMLARVASLREKGL